MLVDPFKRKISYIRISVTDRCDFRCTYCMSEEMQFLPKKDLLSLEELERLSSVFIELGVKKIRITGGEPLVRKNILQLFNSIGRKIGRYVKKVTLNTAKHLIETVDINKTLKIDEIEFTKNKFWKIWLAISNVGGSPGLKILYMSVIASSLVFICGTITPAAPRSI